MIEYEGVWFDYKLKLEGDTVFGQTTGYLHFKVLFVDDQSSCVFSEGIQDPFYDSIQNQIFPLRNCWLNIKIDRLENIQIRNEQYLYCLFSLGKQKERSIKVKEQQVDGLQGEMNIDIGQHDIEGLTIDVYKQQEYVETVVGSLTNFPIQSLINRPC